MADLRAAASALESAPLDGPCDDRCGGGTEVAMSVAAPPSAPVMCTIDDGEIPDRIALLERMRASLDDIERTPTGLFLLFPDNVEIRADLATFTVDEKQCCQFWDFAIVDLPHGVGLRWDAPADADPLIDELL